MNNITRKMRDTFLTKRETYMLSCMRLKQTIHPEQSETEKLRRTMQYTSF